MPLCFPYDDPKLVGCDIDGAGDGVLAGMVVAARVGVFVGSGVGVRVGVG
jgi:hypothetical protein